MDVPKQHTPKTEYPVTHDDTDEGKPISRIANPIFVNETKQKQPRLAILNTDAYNKSNFKTINDGEFTELISSIEGIGIEEFFVLYEELYDQIPSGSLDVGLDFDGDRSIILQISTAANKLKLALIGDDRVETVRSLRSVRAAMEIINEHFKNITTLLTDADPKTHAYLVQQSSLKVITLSTQFQALFDYIILLSSSYEMLVAEVEVLKIENDDLKEQIKQLNDLLLKLMAPDSSGFQVAPDLFSIETVGSNWRAGQSVQVIVCGSADYTFTAPSRFSGKFTWNQIEGTSKWRILTHPSLAGQVAYISVVSNEPTQLAARPSEQIVFVFPANEVPSVLQSSAGELIQLQVPDATTDPEDFTRAGYRNTLITRIAGGTPPYTLRINVPENNQFFTASFEEGPI